MDKGETLSGRDFSRRYVFVSAWLARSSRISGCIWIRVKGGGGKGGQGGNFIRLIRAATHTREVRHPVGMARRSLDALAVHMVDPANDGDDLGVNKPHRGHLCRMFQFYQDEPAACRAAATCQCHRAARWSPEPTTGWRSCPPRPPAPPLDLSG